MLERDFKRLCRAYDAVNQSPMGAAAVTTTGFPVSRERVAELAGFSGMIENAYDAIGNSDYLTQTASAVGLVCFGYGQDCYGFASLGNTGNEYDSCGGRLHFHKLHYASEKKSHCIGTSAVLSVCSEGNGGYGTDRVSEKPVRGYF